MRNNVTDDVSTCYYEHLGQWEASLRLGVYGDGPSEKEALFALLDKLDTLKMKLDEYICNTYGDKE